MKMKTRHIAVLLVALLAAQAAAAAEFFPYKVQKKTLPNQLDVIVIEMPEFKDVLSFNTIILAGSRNEIEKGRTGLAHLFEHIAFRHAYERPEGGYQTQMEKMGAFNNAWTWFDVTYYHPVTFTSNLRELAELEAERFVAMDFSEKIYRTEAGAVFGEYRRNASNPGLRMEEVISDLAYGEKHGYGHTTMGYLEDVKDMPNSYKSGKAFYETYYRPNNAVVIVTGDVKADEVFRLVEQTYGSWKPRRIPEIPDPRPIAGPKRGHVAWESDVPPRVDVAYGVPAYDPGTTESAVIEVIPELIAGETAPLYQRLRYEKKIASEIYTDRVGAIGFDQRLLETVVVLDKSKFDERGQALLTEVEGDVIQGLRDLANFSRRPDAQKTLDAVKSKLRYDLLASLNSPANVAETFALYYRFERDPKVFDTIMNAIQRLTPADIDAFAAKYFVPKNQVIVTMAHKGAGRKSS